MALFMDKANVVNWRKTGRVKRPSEKKDGFTWTQVKEEACIPKMAIVKLGMSYNVYAVYLKLDKKYGKLDSKRIQGLIHDSIYVIGTQIWLVLRPLTSQRCLYVRRLVTTAICYDVMLLN